jgi:hypothetical protein
VPFPGPTPAAHSSDHELFNTAQFVPIVVRVVCASLQLVFIPIYGGREESVRFQGGRIKNS